MMKNLASLSLVLTLVAITQQTIAEIDHKRCGPLTRFFNITLQVGAAPSLYTNRGDILAISTTFDPPQFKVAQIQKFSAMWKQPPLNITGSIGVSAANNIELFVEYNFRYARAKNFSFEGTSPLGQFGFVTPNLSEFKTYAGYGGFRWYTNRFLHNHISFFTGLKGGVVSYKRIWAEPLFINVPFNDQTASFTTTYLKSKKFPSVGIQGGFDISINSNYSFFINTEIVATPGPQQKTLIEKPIIPSTEGIGDFKGFIYTPNGILVSFPVNLGLRFWFC